MNKLEPHTASCPLCHVRVQGARDTITGDFLPKRGKAHRDECPNRVLAFDDTSRAVNVIVDRSNLMFVRIGDMADMVRAVDSLALAVADWAREMPLSGRIVEATGELQRVAKAIRDFEAL